MAVGGIAINMARAPEIEQAISDVRVSMNRTSEVKWSNAKARRDNVHKAYVDLLKALVQSGHLHFHIRFQRLEDWDHTRSGRRRKTDTVSKAYFNLIVHRPVRHYGATCDLHVRPDAGECTEQLHQYRAHMNNAARSQLKIGTNPVRSVHVRDSKKSDFLQLLDVTLGALAAFRNGRHLRDETSDTKRHLAQYVWEVWGKPDMGRSTSMDVKRFNVWNAKPGDSRGP